MPDNSFRECLAYVLVPLLKRELSEFMKLWNTHYIRRNNKVKLPHGIPDDLYSNRGKNHRV